MIIRDRRHRKPETGHADLRQVLSQFLAEASKNLFSQFLLNWMQPDAPH